jgi:hypothetical protein
MAIGTMTATKMGVLKEMTARVDKTLKRQLIQKEIVIVRALSAVSTSFENLLTILPTEDHKQHYIIVLKWGSLSSNPLPTSHNPSLLR